MELTALGLLAVQFALLGVFGFFSAFNYLYGFASLWKPSIRRTTPSGARTAVVIVAYNERHVLEGTLRAVDQLTYPNKLVVLADDSTDPEIVANNLELARARGARKVQEHGLTQTVNCDGVLSETPIEIWESPDFILLRRPGNVGFKAGSLRKVVECLQERNIATMYLLDADWRPQPDALERTHEVLEAYDDVAFVQTKRVSDRSDMNLFQKYVALHEEGCYYVDFEGRQVLDHPTLFSGCCTLLRLEAVQEVGGFTPGHLTEDLDLSDRLWVKGWKGIYLGDVVNYGEVPFTYDDFRRQQERWAAGSARSLRENIGAILKTDKLTCVQKLSAVRQNAYFTSTLFTGLALVIGVGTVLWLMTCWGSYAVECYLLMLETVRVPFFFFVYWCVLANFVEPLIMILVKKREYSEIFHLPMSFWYAWSNLYTYIAGNLKGLFAVELDWFRTPKFDRRHVGRLARVPTTVRVLNACTCVAFLVLYFWEGWNFGWFDEFALLWLPAFFLASLG